MAAHQTHWYVASACLHRLQSSLPTEQLYSTTVDEEEEEEEEEEERLELISII